MTDDVPLTDPANALLAPGPAQLAVGPHPQAPVLVFTLRTTSATVTAWLDKDSALEWADMIRDNAAKLNSSGLVVASAHQALRANANGHG